MDYALIKAAVAAVIKENGNEEITGNILQQVLLAVIDVLGLGYQYMGIATPSTNPGTPDAKVFYIAQAQGTYSNFNDGTSSPVLDGTAIGIFAFDTQWHNTILDVATKSSLAAYLKIADLAAGIGDSETTAMTQKAVTELLDGVATELGKKANKVVDGTSGNLPKLTANGDLADSDIPATDVATKQELAVATLPGLAEAVIDTDGAGTEQQFTFRKSGGDGGAYYRKIKGKTLAWNQGIEDWNFLRQDLWTATSGSLVISSNKATFTKNNSEASAVIDTYYPFIATHNYMVSARVKSSAAIVLRLSIAGGRGNGWDYQQSIPAGQWVDMYGIISNANGPYYRFYITTDDLTDGQTLEIEFANIADLTLAGMPNITASEFLALYPGYHPYNPGKNISNDAEAVETTGANQWDEEWEVGSISALGENVDSTTQIRSKNYIPIFPSTDYYLKAGGSADPTFGRLCYYDANKQFVSVVYPFKNQILTTPDNAFYMRFVENIDTYNGDICINFYNLAINGQYFPYWKRTLQLGLTTKEDTDGNVPFADGMKGAGTASDWADKVGGEKRMVRVDLGSLEWFYDADSNYFWAELTLFKSAGEAICAKYVKGGLYDDTDKTITVAGYHSSSEINIFDSAYTAADLVDGHAAWLEGVYLDYELAIPVPFTWAEPLNLGVKVDENGTERAVQPAGATEPSAPFVADTTYTMSIARMVQKLASI